MPKSLPLDPRVRRVINEWVNQVASWLRSVNVRNWRDVVENVAWPIFEEPYNNDLTYTKDGKTKTLVECIDENDEECINHLKDVYLTRVAETLYNRYRGGTRAGRMLEYTPGFMRYVNEAVMNKTADVKAKSGEGKAKRRLRSALGRDFMIACGSELPELFSVLTSITCEGDTVLLSTNVESALRRSGFQLIYMVKKYSPNVNESLDKLFKEFNELTNDFLIDAHALYEVINEIIKFVGVVDVNKLTGAERLQFSCYKDFLSYVAQYIARECYW